MTDRSRRNTAITWSPAGPSTIVITALRLAGHAVSAVIDWIGRDEIVVYIVALGLDE